MSEINRQLTRYLLGDVTEEEEIEIQESLFEDDFHEELQLAEDDLVTNYVRNKLTPDESKLFEKNYLKESPERIQKVLFSKAVLNTIQKKNISSVPLAQPASVQGRWSFWTSWLSAPAFASLIIGMIAGALVFAFVQKQFFGELIPEPVVAETEKLKQLESDLNTERAKTERLQDENQTLRQKQQQLAEALAKAKPSPNTSANKTEQIVINHPPQLSPSKNPRAILNLEAYASSGTTMSGADELEEFTVNKNISSVTVNLPIGHTPFKKFRVMLKSEPVLERETSRIVNRRGGRAVQVALPTSLLKNGSNTILLYGISSDGNSDEIEGYILSVKKN